MLDEPRRERMLNVPAIVVALLVAARARSRPAVVGADAGADDRVPAAVCLHTRALRRQRAARHRLAGRLGGRHLDVRHLCVHPRRSQPPDLQRRVVPGFRLAGGAAIRSPAILERSWLRRPPPAPPSTSPPISANCCRWWAPRPRFPERWRRRCGLRSSVAVRWGCGGIAKRLAGCRRRRLPRAFAIRACLRSCWCGSASISCSACFPSARRASIRRSPGRPILVDSVAGLCCVRRVRSRSDGNRAGQRRRAGSDVRCPLTVGAARAACARCATFGVGVGNRSSYIQSRAVLGRGRLRCCNAEPPALAGTGQRTRARVACAAAATERGTTRTLPRFVRPSALEQCRSREATHDRESHSRRQGRQYRFRSSPRQPSTAPSRRLPSTRSARCWCSARIAGSSVFCQSATSCACWPSAAPSVPRSRWRRS